MKVGLIILCRYNSSRLPGKILHTLEGKPVLQYILERLQLVEGTEKMVVATSQEKSDDPIHQFCIQQGVECFRGDLRDVSRRFLDCAKHYGFDYAIRINGDNLFVDAQPINDMIKIATDSSYDFLTNVKGRTFPFGMSVEVLKTSFYQQIISEFKEPKYREHVTLYFYENEQSGNFYYHYNDICPESKGLKLAIDDAEDFAFAQSIIRRMDKDHTFYGLREIYNIIAK